MIAPMMAVSQVLTSKKLSRVSTPNSAWPRNPPSGGPQPPDQPRGGAAAGVEVAVGDQRQPAAGLPRERHPHAVALQHAHHRGAHLGLELLHRAAVEVGGGA